MRVIISKSKSERNVTLLLESSAAYGANPGNPGKLDAIPRRERNV